MLVPAIKSTGVAATTSRAGEGYPRRNKVPPTRHHPKVAFQTVERAEAHWVL